MKNRSLKQLETIVTANRYNQTFRTIYSEFETNIFLKIAHKDPAHNSLSEIIAAGFKSKPSYFLGATYYMRIELTLENVYELRDTIFSELYPIIKELSPSNLQLMLRSLLESITKKILQMDLITFEDLMDINFSKILLGSSSFIKAAQQQIPEIELHLQQLTCLRENSMNEYEDYVTNLIATKSSLWKLQNLKEVEYQREIGCEFALSEIKLDK